MSVPIKITKFVLNSKKLILGAQVLKSSTLPTNYVTSLEATNNSLIDESTSLKFSQKTPQPKQEFREKIFCDNIFPVHQKNEKSSNGGKSIKFSPIIIIAAAIAIFL